MSFINKDVMVPGHTRFLEIFVDISLSQDTEKISNGFSRGECVNREDQITILINILYELRYTFTYVYIIS
jgi:hypothetical protein